MSKCEVCDERRGLMVNYASGDSVWMAHPECAARHFQARIAELAGERKDAAAESVENYKRASHYRDALERLARLGNEPYYGNSTGNRIAQDALGIEVGLNA